MMETAAILSTGDELTTGRIADTNARYIAGRLGELGIEVVAMLTVGDYPERIEWAWRQALREADLVISTGGLGPTADDLTTEIVARVAGRRLIVSDEVAGRIRQLFASLGRTMPPNNLKQAQIPENAVIIGNSLGTAPGYRLALETAGGERHLVILPGVPQEMKLMMEESILPWLQDARGMAGASLSRTFQVFGLSESALDEMVTGAVPEGEGRISFRANFPQLSVRLTVKGSRAEAEHKLNQLAARIRARIAPYVYGEGEVTMEEIVGTLLKERRLTLGIAESCTGGLVSYRLTNVPGSSAYLRADVVAYSPETKSTLLGVREETLALFGSVSEEAAREMAMGVKKVAACDIGVAVTGIAGPEGGTPDHPVGTVCLALAAGDVVASRRYRLWGNREWIKLLASQLVLDWLRRHLLGLPLGETPAS